MTTISAIIITLNEEKNLTRCLSSLAFCDEIVVVDSGSTDKTLEIAHKFTKDVIIHNFKDYASQRQFAVSQATCEWILFVDADEEIPETLAKKIMELKEYKNLGTIVFPRKNLFMGKWIKHGGWYPDWQRRMLRRDKVLFLPKSVHELAQEIPEVINLDDNWDKGLAIKHYTYSSIENYLKKMNQCTTLEANDLKDTLKVGKLDIIFRSLGMFSQCYFGKRAYKDGLQGFVVAVLQMINSFMLMLKIIELKELGK